LFWKDDRANACFQKLRKEEKILKIPSDEELQL